MLPQRLTHPVHERGLSLIPEMVEHDGIPPFSALTVSSHQSTHLNLLEDQLSCLSGCRRAEQFLLFWTQKRSQDVFTPCSTYSVRPAFLFMFRMICSFCFRPAPFHAVFAVSVPAVAAKAFSRFNCLFSSQGAER